MTPRWMTTEQAAKYLIVAWKKEWTWNMYLATVAGLMMNMRDHAAVLALRDEAAARYPWIADRNHFIRGIRVMRTLPIMYPKLNDCLWSAREDAVALMALWQRVARLKAPKKQLNYYNSDIQKLRNKSRSEDALAKTAHLAVQEANKHGRWVETHKLVQRPTNVVNNKE